MVSCAAEPTRAFQTEQGAPVAAAPINELILGWHKVNGVRPQGAPVGMTVAADRALWLVQDKNHAIIRIDVPPHGAGHQLPCDARTAAQHAELARFVPKGNVIPQPLTQV